MERKYQHIKLFRTYIGETKKAENALFNKVQGIDNDSCNWLEYRRMLITSLNDELHTTFSRKFTFKWLTLISLLFLSLVVNSPILLILGIFITLSLIILHLKNKFKEIKLSNTYILYLCTVNSEIRKRYGINLTI
jgi:hypothetical protein